MTVEQMTFRDEITIIVFNLFSSKKKNPEVLAHSDLKVGLTFAKIDRIVYWSLLVTPTYKKNRTLSFIFILYPRKKLLRYLHYQIDYQLLLPR